MRQDISAILANPLLRRRMLVGVIVATQEREGIETSPEQAGAAYDAIREEARIKGLVLPWETWADAISEAEQPLSAPPAD